MLDHLPNALPAALFNMSLTADVIIVCVLIARLVLRRAPKVFSYALWAVVLFRLLCPVSVGSAVSLLGLLDAPVEETAPNVSAVRYTQYLPQAVYSDPYGGGQPAVWPESGAVDPPRASPAETTAENGASPAEAAAPSLTPAEIAARLWLAGFAAMLAYSAVSLLMLRRRLVGATPLRDNIYYADHIDTPFVMGLLRPKIYLPSSLSPAEQGYILLHEQYHIRRLDHVVKLLSFAALALHWFNPLVWAAFVLSGKDMEMSCDEAVVKKLGDGIRADYSASLLSLSTGRRIIAGTPLAFGEGNTKGRIKNLLRWKRPKTWMVLLAGLACVAVTVACAANPPAEAEQPADPGAVPTETDGAAGQYGSMEDYVESRVRAAMDENTIAYSYNDNGALSENPIQDAVAGARAADLTCYGSLEGLAPEGVLELWEWTLEIKPVNAENREIFMAGGSYVTEDGYIHNGSELVVALRYGDGGRYDILQAETGPEHMDFFAYHYTIAEALHDWYVREYALDRPLYVRDWRDRITVPEPGSLGNYPVHRFDGDGWYCYIPVSAWYLESLLSNPDTGHYEFSWVSGYGTGSRLTVDKFTQSLADQQTVAQKQGYAPAGDTGLVWERRADGKFSRYYLAEAPDGKCFRVNMEWMEDSITDYPYIAIEPQVLTLMAESFTLDEGITAGDAVTADAVRQAVNGLLVGSLSYDPDWTTAGPYTLTATDQATGRVDVYRNRWPEAFYGLDSTPGDRLAMAFTWTQAAGDVPDSGYTLRFENAGTAITVWSGAEALQIERGGEATLYQAATPDRPRESEFSQVFQVFQPYAAEAEYARELTGVCSVDGSETDYDAVAGQLTELWAQALRNRPGWYGQSAQDVQPGASSVFDAYYGEDNPNFCFHLNVYLKLTPEQTDMWQAGSGLDDPIAEGEYRGWYGYGREACAAKGADGNWRLTGLNTGGSSVNLPVDLFREDAMEDVSADGLISLYFRTSGFTHDYLLLNRMTEKPLEEVKSAMAALPTEERRELRRGILAFIDEYPDHGGWTAEDFA